MQAMSDGRDVSFALFESAGGGVDGVVTGHEIVRMLDRGTQHEAGIGYRFERDRPVTFFEYDRLTRRNIRWHCNDALVGRNPDDVMILRRLIRPAFSSF